MLFFVFSVSAEMLKEAGNFEDEKVWRHLPFLLGHGPRATGEALGVLVA